MLAKSWKIIIYNPYCQKAFREIRNNKNHYGPKADLLIKIRRTMCVYFVPFLLCFTCKYFYFSFIKINGKYTVTMFTSPLFTLQWGVTNFLNHIKLCSELNRQGCQQKLQRFKFVKLDTSTVKSHNLNIYGKWIPYVVVIVLFRDNWSNTEVVKTFSLFSRLCNKPSST